MPFYFKHALTHEVAYGSLLQEWRRTLRAGIIETLERFAPERVADSGTLPRGLGTLYTQRGRREQAHTELSTTIMMYRTMDMTFWLPQTKVVLAQVVTR
jgi:hypothetical protein